MFLGLKKLIQTVWFIMKNKYIDQPRVQIKIVIIIFIGRQDESI